MRKEFDSKEENNVWDEAVKEGRNKKLVSELEELKWKSHKLINNFGMTPEQVKIVNELCVKSNHSGIDDAIQLIKNYE